MARYGQSIPKSLVNPCARGKFGTSQTSPATGTSHPGRRLTSPCSNAPTRRSRRQIPAPRPCSPASRTKAGRRWRPSTTPARAALSTSSRCTPTPASPRTWSASSRSSGARWNGAAIGKLPIWVTELSWPAAQGKTVQHHDFETTDRGQADRLKAGLPMLADERKALAHRAGVLVHVAVPRGDHGQRLRLLRAPAPARRSARQCAGVDGFHAPGASVAGLRKAVRRRTPLPLTRIRCKPRAGARRLSRCPGGTIDPTAARRPRSPVASAS